MPLACWSDACRWWSWLVHAHPLLVLVHRSTSPVNQTRHRLSVTFFIVCLPGNLNRAVQLEGELRMKAGLTSRSLPDGRPDEVAAVDELVGRGGRRAERGEKHGERCETRADAGRRAAHGYRDATRRSQCHNGALGADHSAKSRVHCLGTYRVASSGPARRDARLIARRRHGSVLPSGAVPISRSRPAK